MEFANYGMEHISLRILLLIVTYVTKKFFFREERLFSDIINNLLTSLVRSELLNIGHRFLVQTILSVNNPLILCIYSVISKRLFLMKF